MIASKVAKDSLSLRSKAGSYWIHLTTSPAAREDAWDLCRVAIYYGGVEVCDCRFAFASEEQWRTALEALRFRFGPEYFEAVDSAESI